MQRVSKEYVTGDEQVESAWALKGGIPVQDCFGLAGGGVMAYSGSSVRGGGITSR